MGQVPAELRSLLDDFTHRLRRVVRVHRVILFGSQARGELRAGSDIDLLIVSEDFEGLDLVERHLKVQPVWTSELPVDLLPYTPREFDELRQQITLVRTAVREGAVLA